MGRFVNPDNSAFQVALNSEIYIDKSGMIEEINKVLDTMQGYICHSRPRRFGKSITANMLAAYYSKGCKSEKMFSELEISKKDDFKMHLNKYNVIHIDIQWFLSNVKDIFEIVEYISQSIIEELRQIYPEHISTDENALSEALSKIKEATGQKFIIIIDEWDALIRDEDADRDIQEKYINFLRGLFKGTEPTKYIALAYLTGILPIKKQKTQSALNNFDEYTMLNAGRFSPFVGFTEKEVEKLCNHYERDFNEIKHWYDGYILGEQHIYNPKAVVSAMLDGTLQSYWSQTSTFESIRPFINMDFDGLKTKIIRMISGDEVKVKTTTFQNDMITIKNKDDGLKTAIIAMISGAEVKVNTGTFKNDTLNIKSKDDVLTYMIHLGYLGYDQTRKMAFIPNEEIRGEFVNAVEENKWNELYDFENKSNELLEATLDLECDIVAEKIEQIHSEYTSVIEYNNENSLSSVLAIAYLSAMQYYFKPVREMPAGRGFADFVFIPKPQYLNSYPALVVELKWNKNVSTALAQIKERKYPQSLMEYTGDILLVGINYDKKNKAHECEIEQYEI